MESKRLQDMSDHDLLIRLATLQENDRDSIKCLSHKVDRLLWKMIGTSSLVAGLLTVFGLILQRILEKTP